MEAHSEVALSRDAGVRASNGWEEPGLSDECNQLRTRRGFRIRSDFSAFLQTLASGSPKPRQRYVKCIIIVPSLLDLDMELPDSSPLSHSAARHKIAVRPKKTHGLPRNRRLQQRTSTAALPTMPEVNEESWSGVSSSRSVLHVSTSPPTHSVLEAIPRVEETVKVRSEWKEVKENWIDLQEGSSPEHPEIQDSKDETPKEDGRKTSRHEDSSFFSRIFGSRRSLKKKKDLPPTPATEVPKRINPNGGYGQDAPSHFVKSEERSPVRIRASSLASGQVAHVEASFLADGNREEESLMIQPEVIRKKEAMVRKAFSFKRVTEPQDLDVSHLPSLPAFVNNEKIVSKPRPEKPVRMRKMEEVNVWKGKAESPKNNVDEKIETRQLVWNATTPQMNGHTQNGKFGDEEESTESRRRSLFGDVLRNTGLLDGLDSGPKSLDSVITSRSEESGTSKRTISYENISSIASTDGSPEPEDEKEKGDENAEVPIPMKEDSGKTVIKIQNAENINITLKSGEAISKVLLESKEKITPSFSKQSNLSDGQDVKSLFLEAKINKFKVESMQSPKIDTAELNSHEFLNRKMMFQRVSSVDEDNEKKQKRMWPLGNGELVLEDKVTTPSRPKHLDLWSTSNEDKSTSGRPELINTRVIQAQNPEISMEKEHKRVGIPAAFMRQTSAPLPLKTEGALPSRSPKTPPPVAKKTKPSSDAITVAPIMRDRSFPLFPVATPDGKDNYQHPLNVHQYPMSVKGRSNEPTPLRTSPKDEKITPNLQLTENGMQERGSVGPLMRDRSFPLIPVSTPDGKDSYQHPWSVKGRSNEPTPLRTSLKDEKVTPNLQLTENGMQERGIVVPSSSPAVPVPERKAEVSSAIPIPKQRKLRSEKIISKQKDMEVINQNNRTGNPIEKEQTEKLSPAEKEKLRMSISPFIKPRELELHDSNVDPKSSSPLREKPETKKLFPITRIPSHVLFSEDKKVEVEEDNSNKLQHEERQVPLESTSTANIAKETFLPRQKSDEGKHSPPAKHNGVVMQQKDPSRSGQSEEKPVNLRRKPGEPKDGQSELMKIFHRRSLKSKDDISSDGDGMYQMSRSQTEPTVTTRDSTAVPVHKMSPESLSPVSTAKKVPIEGNLPASQPKTSSELISPTPFHKTVADISSNAVPSATQKNGGESMTPLKKTSLEQAFTTGPMPWKRAKSLVPAPIGKTPEIPQKSSQDFILSRVPEPGPSSRTSKVLDLVNSFQKLQVGTTS
ncbi:unnamed protein product [Darwinula stevensoni]|uniref:Uncharacterized protein n=1 Tax=Darwinula stevensoni TaxID=69355 RepID=A0A7R9FQG1_9CRUS|nr:unnamed protein product [Darwinula stevensoni]CAG0899363.1 unnamed protein product [Darwinula stevensoni]